MKKSMFLVHVLLAFLAIQALHAQEDLTHKMYGYSQVDFRTSEDPTVSEGFQLKRINLINEFQTNVRSRFVADVEFEEGTDISSQETKGVVKVSRGFFEYNIDKNTSLIAGKILTPYGLLNEVHDFSIIYLPIQVPLPYRPQNIGPTGSERFFSKYSTGVSLKHRSTPFHQYKWNNQLTIGNGARETDEGADTNQDKSYSFRSTLAKSYRGTISQLGLSVYTEKDSYPLGEVKNTRYWSYGLDFKIETDLINFSTEVFYNTYPTLEKNYQRALAYYTLLGVNVTDTLTPYILYSKSHLDLARQSEYEQGFHLGVYYLFSPQIVLKTEWEQVKRDSALADKTYDTLGATLAISF